MLIFLLSKSRIESELLKCGFYLKSIINDWGKNSSEWIKYGVQIDNEEDITFIKLKFPKIRIQYVKE